MYVMNYVDINVKCNVAKVGDLLKKGCSYLQYILSDIVMIVILYRSKHKLYTEKATRSSFYKY